MRTTRVRTYDLVEKSASCGPGGNAFAKSRQIRERKAKLAANPEFHEKSLRNPRDAMDLVYICNIRLESEIFILYEYVVICT